jgi:putative PIN family toxin of toxin-antitoxin system
MIRDFSKVVLPKVRLAVIADDPDNRILECSLEGQADYIISGDKHLLNLKNYQGITIVTPGDFWESCR